MGSRSGELVTRNNGGFRRRRRRRRGFVLALVGLALGRLLEDDGVGATPETFGCNGYGDVLDLGVDGFDSSDPEIAHF